MPYSPPAVPISGTVITVAFANSLITNGIAWLRQITGGADPGASNLALISTSATTSSWQSVPTAAIANSAVTDAKLALQKVNQVNPTYTTFGATLPEGSGFYDVNPNPGDSPLGATGRWLLMQNRHWNWGADYRWQFTCDMDNAANIYSRSVLAGAGSAWHRIFHSGMDGAGSGIDADLLDGVQGSGYALVANGCPSGLIASFRNAGAIAAGWARCDGAGGRPDMNGRVAVGAGTTFGVTITEDATRGTSWDHSHTLTGNTGTVNTGTTYDEDETGAVRTTAAIDHTHGLATAATTNTAWVIPAFGVVWAIKT